MLSTKHPSARCRDCGEPLYYTLKDEPTGWKVQYSCPPPEGCGRERSLGWIGATPGTDEADARRTALELGRKLR